MFHHFDEQVILEGRPELSVVVVLRHQRPPFDDNAWLNRAETARVISSEWSTLPLPMRGRGSVRRWRGFRLRPARHHFDVESRHAGRG